MIEGAERRASMCQDFYLIFSIRESISFQSAAIFLCPKGTTQISHGTSTKLRYNLSESNILLRTLVSMVPNAHSLKLLFPTRYTSRSIYQSSMCDSQSASSCVLTSWMRTQECNTSMIPDTYSLKLLFLARYIPRSVYYDNSHLTYY